MEADIWGEGKEEGDAKCSPVPDTVWSLSAITHTDCLCSQNQDIFSGKPKVFQQLFHRESVGNFLLIKTSSTPQKGRLWIRGVFQLVSSEDNRDHSGGLRIDLQWPFPPISGAKLCQENAPHLEASDFFFFVIFFSLIYSEVFRQFLVFS